MNPLYETKPDKAAFVYYGIIRHIAYGVIALGLLSIVLAFVLPQFIPFIALGAIIIFTCNTAFAIFNINIAYKKEKYLFFKDKIIQTSGNLFYDSQTEIFIKNITHATLKLPFIENKLFNTGAVFIQTAGSSGSEISVRSHVKAKYIFEKTLKLMQQNGFKLQQTKQLQRETPDAIVITLELVFGFAASLVGFFFFVAPVAYMIVTVATKGIVAIALTGIITVLAGIMIFTNIVLRYLDKRNRKYTIYNDSVTYAEGFLTKYYSIIPAENIADTNTEQQLIQRILGVSQIVISCQGSGQEIVFSYIKHAKLVKQNIDQIVKEKPKKQTQSKVVTEKKPLKKVVRNTAFTITYKMHKGAALGPYLLGAIIALIPSIILPPLFFALAFGIGYRVLQVLFTKYTINKDSVEEEFDFIQRRQKVFTFEKVTSVIVSESIIDRMFGTGSIKFWSIGGTQNITLQHIKLTKDIIPEMLEKYGVTITKPKHKVSSNFGLPDHFKGGIIIYTVIILALLAGIVIAITTPFILLLIPIAMAWTAYVVYMHFYYKTSHLYFFDQHVMFTRGILIKKRFYTLLDDIKGVTTVKYPLTNVGILQLDIAGETAVQTRNGQYLQSNSFAIKFIDDITTKDEFLDKIMLNQIKDFKKLEKAVQERKTVAIASEKPNMTHAIVPILITSVIIFPFIILLPFSMTYIFLRTKAITYVLEQTRLFKKSGILYKRQKSILIKKIDHINKAKGLPNKIFKDGNVYVNTTGSSKAELVIANIKQFEEFYEKLRKIYKI